MKPRFEDAPISVENERARILKMNNDAAPEVRERTAAHELAHHMYAKHLGVGSEGIELGYKVRKEGPGRTLLTKWIEEKMANGTFTKEDADNYLHVVLANGFGEEVVFDTHESDWSDFGDKDIVIENLRRQGKTSEKQQERFIQESRAQARQFFSKPEVVEQLRRAYKPLAEKHWRGRIGPVRIARYLEEGK
jgi:hypothetical protein